MSILLILAKNLHRRNDVITSFLLCKFLARISKMLIIQALIQLGIPPVKITKNIKNKIKI